MFCILSVFVYVCHIETHCVIFVIVYCYTFRIPKMRVTVQVKFMGATSVRDSLDPCSIFSLTFSLIELLDYPVVYLDLAKESNEMVDSEDKDNHESDSDKELALSASPYRQLAQEIMVINQEIYSINSRINHCA